MLTPNRRGPFGPSPPAEANLFCESREELVGVLSRVGNLGRKERQSTSERLRRARCWARNTIIRGRI